MKDFISQMLIELRNVYNIIHGPEIWLALPFIAFAILVSALAGYWVFDKWE